MTDKERAINELCEECCSYDYCVKKNQLHCAETVAYIKGLAEGRKELELSYEVEEVTKAELNKCKTIEEKMEWLGKVLGQAIFKNDMNYAVWVNVQKNNIIEQLEKENEQLKEQIEKMWNKGDAPWKLWED